MRNGLFVEAAGFYDSAVSHHLGQFVAFDLDAFGFVPSDVGEVAVQVLFGAFRHFPSGIFGDHDDVVGLYFHYFHQTVGHGLLLAVLTETLVGERAEFCSVEVAYFRFGQYRIESRCGSSGLCAAGCGGLSLAAAGCQYGNEG